MKDRQRNKTSISDGYPTFTLNLNKQGRERTKNKKQSKRKCASEKGDKDIYGRERRKKKIAKLLEPSVRHKD